MDKEKFVEEFVASQRVWSQTTFECSLSDTRTAEEKTAILEKLYHTTCEILRGKDPASDVYKMSLLRCVIRKS